MTAPEEGQPVTTPEFDEVAEAAVDAEATELADTYDDEFEVEVEVGGEGEIAPAVFSDRPVQTVGQAADNYQRTETANAALWRG